MKTTTIEAFHEQKNKLTNILNKINTFLQLGKNIGGDIGQDISQDIGEDILHKLTVTQNSDTKLKIALIGGFSEGKTSIASAWLGKVDDSMKISESESSDMIMRYAINDECELIDTPGLFGFKGKEISPDKITKYKEITKNYISEANLLLYVMNPVNPIKDSHIEDIKWLFRELNLLPRTIFVLSRFDNVADLEDEEEYQEELEIKSKNIIARLTSVIHLTDEEIQNLSIVAVSANPYGKGLGYWQNNNAEFNTISHINDLEDATQQKISTYGEYNLFLDTYKSIILDITKKFVPKANNQLSEVKQDLKDFTAMEDDLNNKVKTTTSDIKTTISDLRKFINIYFGGLCAEVENTGLESFSDFIQRSIGSEGCIVNETINNEFQHAIKYIEDSSSSINQEINFQVNNFHNGVINPLTKNALKDGANVLSKFSISNTTVLATRDAITGTAKIVGLDFGNLLKFKPWGAIKLADSLSKGFSIFGAVIGFGIEAYDSYKQAEAENNLRKAKKDIKDDLESQRKNLVDQLKEIDESTGLSKFILNNISIVQDNIQRIKDIQVKIDEVTQLVQKIQKFKDTGDIIEAEFKVIQ
ncbi:MAG: hypothetical protein ATN32_08330 [Candidatus Epulonipiscium fishelsonii]|nr:MAG: hypothetical protein ATN32_08330 [Epulopiscium sp. AS2M-Bin002]